MIKKLRWKFVIYAELSILALLAAILVGINIANFSAIAEEADEITLKIANNGGNFGMMFESEASPRPEDNTNTQDPRIPFNPVGPDSPEIRDSVRFFTVKFDGNGVGQIEPDNFHMNAFTHEEAISWAKTLLGHEKGWDKSFYRYRCYTLSSDAISKYVTVIDQARELSPSYRVLNASIIGSLVGLILSFFALLWASKLFVGPLEQSDKKQRRFISDASHELKTPLTIISANAELLEMQYGKNDQTTAIYNQIRRLTQIIRELNDLARLQEEKLVLEQIDLSSIAQEVVGNYASILEQKKIALEEEIEEGILAKENEEAFTHLLNIVMDNACKYALSHVSVRIKKEESRVYIRIANDAENIADGPLDRVFERFYRADEARASTVEGSGIGLSIAKAIVDQLHGRIYAKGKNGEFILKIEL